MSITWCLCLSEVTPEGRRITKLDQILLNGNNITMVSETLACLLLLLHLLLLFCSSSLEEKVLKYENGPTPVFCPLVNVDFMFCDLFSIYFCPKLKPHMATRASFLESKWEMFWEKNNFIFQIWLVPLCCNETAVLDAFLWFRRLKVDWTELNVSLILNRQSFSTWKASLLLWD